MHKIKLIIYYLLVSKLPHSRLIKFSNRIRMWYVSKVLRLMPFDKNSKFEYNVYLSNAKNVRFGKYVRINENVFLQGEVSIGNYVMIAPNVSVYSNTHVYDDINVPMVTCGTSITKEVVIEDDVWIGKGVVILPGVTIKKGAIVGANSVVTKDVNSYTIVGGVPARLIKERK